MKDLHSILVVVDRNGGAEQAVGKAVSLARQFGARIELYLCEGEQAYELAHAYDRTGVERARELCIVEAKEFLQELKAAMNAGDLDISIDADCASPLYEAIVRKALRSKPDLVIKSAHGGSYRQRTVSDPNDWQLMRACPSTLMLTMGRTWRGHPRIAAAVDVPAKEIAGLPEDVLKAARTLAWGWSCEFDVLNSEAEGECPEDRSELHRLCDDSRVPFNRVHFLNGQPETTLAPFAALQDYDVLVIGALSHRSQSGIIVGTLTSKLLDALDCDFVLVKPQSYQCPVEDAVPYGEPKPQQQAGVA
jgi:universal stress protein E